MLRLLSLISVDDSVSRQGGSKSGIESKKVFDLARGLKKYDCRECVAMARRGQ